MKTYDMSTRGTGNETYFDTAEGLTMTRERAIIELKRHGLTDRADLELFDKHFGTVTTYDAQAVLIWLGY